jgi:5-hydroxyisourate hydrolase
MGKVTTHVLDVAAGLPAAGMRIELRGASFEEALAVACTGGDGRSPPLLAGDALRAGRYTLTFHVAEYFQARGVQLPEPPFLGEVIVHFGVADPSGTYHIPLLVTPWSYSTYRGS